MLHSDAETSYHTGTMIHLVFSLFSYKPTLLFIILSLSSINTVSSDELKPFTTDGCSQFPEGTYRNKNLWLACCTKHDIAYWQGGTYEQRANADIKLRDCVRQVGEPLIADLMLNGVRVGGSPFWPTDYRWGYGWSYLRFYKALDGAEQTQVNRKLAEYQVMNNSSE